MCSRRYHMAIGGWGGVGWGGVGGEGREGGREIERERERWVGGIPKHLFSIICTYSQVKEYEQE